MKKIAFLGALLTLAAGAVSFAHDNVEYISENQMALTCLDQCANEAYECEQYCEGFHPYYDAPYYNECMYNCNVTYRACRNQCN